MRSERINASEFWENELGIHQAHSPVVKPALRVVARVGADEDEELAEELHSLRELRAANELTSEQYHEAHKDAVHRSFLRMEAKFAEGFSAANRSETTTHNER